VAEPLVEPCWFPVMVLGLLLVAGVGWLERTTAVPFENSCQHLGTEGSKRTAEPWMQSKVLLFFPSNSPVIKNFWYFSIFDHMKLSFSIRALRGATVFCL